MQSLFFNMLRIQAHYQSWVLACGELVTALGSIPITHNHLADGAATRAMVGVVTKLAAGATAVSALGQNWREAPHVRHRNSAVASAELQDTRLLDIVLIVAFHDVLHSIRGELNECRTIEQAHNIVRGFRSRDRLDQSHVRVSVRHDIACTGKWSASGLLRRSPWQVARSGQALKRLTGLQSLAVAGLLSVSVGSFNSPCAWRVAAPRSRTQHV